VPNDLNHVFQNDLPLQGHEDPVAPAVERIGLPGHQLGTFQSIGHATGRNLPEPEQSRKLGLCHLALAGRSADVLDVWLHQSFDTVLSAPVPANLLRWASQ
jgi:hypothetical protein